jgi:hypothetical protein
MLAQTNLQNLTYTTMNYRGALDISPAPLEKGEMKPR